MNRTVKQALAPYTVSEQWLGRHYLEDHAVEEGLDSLLYAVVKTRDGFRPGYTTEEVWEDLTEEFWGGVADWREATMH